ncbi:MAG: hypothetical protein WBA74_12795, partial [Cyclobacteriaceae bacterium]
NMFLTNIIGYGIRSEILHKLFPAFFPIMTQRTLWAMYFLSDKAREFIAIEHKSRSGEMRVSHNWQYDYPHFAFVNNVVGNLLKEKLLTYDITLNSDIWYGYINMFLVEIAKDHKDEIKTLHTWTNDAY